MQKNVQLQNQIQNVSTLHKNKSSLHSNVSSKSGTWNPSSALDATYGGSMSSLVHSNSSPSNSSNIGGSEVDLRLSDSGNKVVNHGKPNLAPKPPTAGPTNNNFQANNGKPSPPSKNTNGRPPSRAQSLRVPRYLCI